MKKINQPVKKNFKKVYGVFLAFLVSFVLVWGFYTLHQSVSKKISNGEDKSPISSPHDFTHEEIPGGETKDDISHQKEGEQKDGNGIDTNTEIPYRKIGTHTIPNQPIEIEIPTPVLGDVEEVPNYNQLLRMNDLQQAFESLSSYLKELEERLEKNPQDQSLKQEIKEIREQLDKVKREREILLNGDI